MKSEVSEVFHLDTLKSSSAANTTGVKRKRCIEEISPEVPQKPFKRKKQDKLVNNFKDVFRDICTTPTKQPDDDNGGLMSKSQKMQRS